MRDDVHLRAGRTRWEPKQVVLVLQGGGALGAYQVGVYQALHEADVEPDWVIGTSIGAINGCLIAGNDPADRMERLAQFWRKVELSDASSWAPGPAALGRMLMNLQAIGAGIPGFFLPSLQSLLGARALVGVEAAAYYTTAPLRQTIGGLADFDRINAAPLPTRLTVGAVNVRTGDMRYFDNREERLGAEHVMASGALPPAFPAVRIDGEPYWDGGIYSNTPIEVVLDDKPRRDSLIFSVQMWRPDGNEPRSLWEVVGRHKDIQYASRSKSHIARQEQIHRLRHIVRELAKRLPDEIRADPDIRELASYGCGTRMHVVPLQAPMLPGEDHTKDIDFSSSGIQARWRAGYETTRRALAEEAWHQTSGALDGVIVHEVDEGEAAPAEAPAPRHRARV